jgi:flagellar motility protein MotE (MotC chaperone)
MMRRGLAASLVICAGLLQPVAAQETSEGNADPDLRKVIETYCTTVSDLAAERRVARQTWALKELEAKVQDRLGVLEQSTQELSDLIRKRDELRNLAKAELVDIYAGMDAEAAAAQMERLDPRLASSVLRQLKPRQASAILDVMKPEVAAVMMRLIAVPAAEGTSTQ